MPGDVPGTAPRRRRGLLVFAFGILVGPFGVACSFALNFNGIDDGVRDASSVDVTVARDGAVLDRALPPPADDVLVAADDAGLDDASDAADTAPTGPCANLPGPAMVSIDDGGFCIDSTEVTVAQYIDFLTAKAGNTSGQDPICTWNTSIVPGDPWPPTGSTAQAVVRVNWCQARFYCEWAGKRLCGSFDGGPGDPNGYMDPTESMWFNICTHDDDGLHVFPYGNTYDPAACNGADYDAGGPLPSLSTCQGGYPGVFDMSGNVFEWEDRCVLEDAGPEGDYCFIRGGAFDQPEQFMRCDEGYEVTRSGQSSNVGFRCCEL